MSEGETPNKKSSVEEVLEKMQEDVAEIKDKVAAACLMHYFYFGALAVGLSSSLIYEIFRSAAAFDLSIILLYGLSICLWMRFWLYDTREPGLKCKPLVKGKIREGIFYSLGLILVFCIIAVFLFVGQPLFYMGFLAITYGFKGVWHHYHQKNFKEDSVQCNTLRLASLSDLVVAFILGIYSIIFLCDLYIFPAVSVPSFLGVDLNSYVLKIFIDIFVIGTIAGLEIHYYATEKMLNVIKVDSKDVRVIGTK